MKRDAETHSQVLDSGSPMEELGKGLGNMDSKRKPTVSTNLKPCVFQEGEPQTKEHARA